MDHVEKGKAYQTKSSNAGGSSKHFPSMQKAVLCQARCVNFEGRLLADAVDQAVGPKVCKHSMQGGHGTEDGTRHGEAYSV